MTTEIEKSEKKTSKTLSPFDDFDKFFERIFSRNSLRSRIGDNFFSDVFSDAEHAFPKIDLIEHKKEYVVKAELPGMEKDDIDIKVDANSVTIRGDLRKEESEEKGDYCQKEIHQSHYYRNLSLPSEVDADSVKAKFKNGVVTLTLRKAKNSEKRSVSID